MKKVLGILLVVAMVVSVMPVVSFASDASQLPDELANYQVGKVYYDVNFDDGTLTGTNGKALSEIQMTTASSTISDGVFYIKIFGN